jgi:CBS domain-containing membrane protein
LNSIKKYFQKMKGFEKSPPRKPFSKIAWSWIGAFIGIYSIALLNNVLQINGVDSIFLIGSFGASAVLVFGAPNAELSQPRNLILGHLVSAIIGVSFYLLIPGNASLACALSVATSIAAMHFIKALHPPGGATALIAIIGAPKIHQLGFWYVLSPVLSGTIILLIIALIVNNLSSNPKRQYPRYWY